MNRAHLILALASLAWLIAIALIIASLRWPDVAINVACAIAAVAITAGLFALAFGVGYRK